VCSHLKVSEINEALVADESPSVLADRFGVSRFSIRRHGINHLPVLLVEAEAAERFANAETLIDRLQQLTDEARAIKGKAEASGDLRTALASVRELVRIVELLGKLQGDLDEHPTVTITVIPEWRIVLGVLDAYPDARIAVARALDGAA
jgi:hypothetical protein